MDVRHDIFAVHHNRGPLGRAQGDVQDGAVFSQINFVPAKHGIDASAQAGLIGEFEQQAEGFSRDPVLGIIQEEPDRFGGKAFPAFGIGGEHFFEELAFDLFGMGAQRLPRR